MTMETAPDARSDNTAPLRKTAPGLSKLPGVLASWPEWVWVGGMVILFLLVNLATGDRCPGVAIDEVTYSEPAVNLYLGRGFTSSAWYGQGRDEFWAGNVPLHAAVLFVWLKLFGFGILSIRSLNFVMISVSALLLWLAVKRLGLIRLARYRVAMVLLVHSGYGIFYSYRTARPDSICILLASAALLAYSIPHRKSRLAALGGLGVLFPIAGLQLAAFAATVGLLLLIFLRMRCFREVVTVGLGCVVGGFLLFAFYSCHGVWDAFLASTIGTHGAAGRNAGLVYKCLRWTGKMGGIRDFSFVVLALASLLLAISFRVRRRFAWRSPLGFAIAAAVAIPAAIFLLGVYPIYYAWMGYIPVGICLCSAMATSQDVLSARFRRVAFPAVIGLACFFGPPMILGICAVNWKDRDYRRVEEFVRSHLRDDDRVIHDGAAFYAVKTKVAAVTGRHYRKAMTPEEKDQISVLFIDPCWLEAYRKDLGGRWTECREPLAPSRPPLPGLLGSALMVRQYNLHVYRRAEPETMLAGEVPERSSDATARRPTAARARMAGRPPDVQGMRR